MTTLQQRMFTDLHEKKLFEDAFEYGSAYIEKASQRNVYPEQAALDNLSVFDEPMPMESGDAGQVLKLLNEFGAPATVAQTGGRYFGFVNGGAVPCGLAAKILGSFWDQNTAMYVLSPVAARLERVVEGWLKKIFNFSPQTVAGYVSGTSSANLCGIAAARFRILKNLGWDVNIKGLSNAPRMRIVASEEVHSTVLKVVSLLGFGRDQVELIPTDEQGRIKEELIPPLDHKTLLILAAGNVHSGSFDNFSTICRQAKMAGCMDTY